MKKIFIYILIFSLLPFGGFEVGYNAYHYIASKPQGEWKKVMNSNRPTFGDVAYNWPWKILSVIDSSTIYLYVQDGFIWKCDLETNMCEKTNQETFPFDNNVIAFTHDVPASEVPQYPTGHKLDAIKISSTGGEYILYEYYLLMNDGTIWNWGYFDSTKSIMIEIGSITVGVVGVILGLIIASIIVVLSVIRSRKIPKESGSPQTLV